MRPLRRTLLAFACAASVIGFVPVQSATECPFKQKWRCAQTQMMSGAGNARANSATPAASVLGKDLTSPALSLDGLTLAFSSDATNLVGNDTNRAADIFIRKTETELIFRASTDAQGRQANGPSYSPALSVDGRWLVFISEASNLVAGDTNGVSDVFLKNLNTGAIRRLSVRAGGVQANGPSNRPFISLYGDWVTFDSEASNLSANDSNGLSDAFIWTRRTSSLRRLVAPDLEGDPVKNEDRLLFEGVVHTGSASISHDGYTLAFHRLVHRKPLPGEPEMEDAIPMAADVFVKTPRVWEPRRWVPKSPGKKGYWIPGKWHGGWKRIAMPAWAGKARKMLENPLVTADGHYVSFEAWSAITLADTAGVTDDHSAVAPNDLSAACLKNLGIPASQTCFHTDYRTIYLYDQWHETQFPVSTKLIGPLAYGDCYDASPNAYGTVIAFTCDEKANNLVPGDTNDASDVFVKDLPGRSTGRISISATDGEGFGTSNRPSISYEGRRVAFASDVATFVGSDNNNASDVFLRDRLNMVPNQPPLLKQPFEATQGLDVGRTFRFRLQGSDPENNVLRYGAIAGLPDGARIDPVTGEFTWTPTPEQTEPGGKRYQVVVWVSDANGGMRIPTKEDPRSSLQLIKLYVRDTAGTARCDAHHIAPEHVQGACNPVG